jgi:predicted membrane protein
VNREESGEDYVNITAFFGGMNRVVSSKDFKGANVFCMFGGVELDLRNAGVKGDSATINVTSLFGGAEIMVPQGWAVDLRGTPLFGGIEDKTSGAEDGSVTVIIKSMTAFGGLELRN